MYPTALLKRPFSALIFFSFLSNGALFAQSSKDGDETITTTGVIFNRYDVLASSASAGATTITVTNIANLAASAIAGAANNPYATDALAYGDLLMIIKMQGATIITTNDATYGTVSAYNNTGVYELVLVSSIAGNVITISPALTNTFNVSSTERVQVVRIPRLNTLTINSGGSLTGSSWGSGYTGGIIALDISGSATIDGTINANGIGFRGGVASTTNSSTVIGVAGYVSTLISNGGEKGESIAGYQADYTAGRYQRGAPANGGGGGNSHNCGGGGGANGGVLASWTGMGTPNNSGGAGWTSAWNLEYAGFATTSSSGGGRGGYSFSGQNRNATSLGPGQSLWNGDDRQNRGGLGGRPLTYTSNTLFLGGGGGSGDANQNSGGSGANGGGIVFLTVMGNINGTGSITANGASAPNSTNLHKDGMGGGGGGGAIRLNVQGAISGISVTANGGNGGNQLLSGDNEAEGPGGGGGGGYVSISGTSSITPIIALGANGTTTSDGLTEFTPNGATGGGVGSQTTLSFVAAPDIPLPVRLECFDMISLGETKVQVNWVAYDEVDVLRYELQQGDGSGQWKTIVNESSQAGNNPIKRYSITINRPAENAYYRLKAVDRDGSLNYTCTKTLKASALKNIVVTHSNKKLYISHPDKSCDFVLTNSFGQRMHIAVYRNASSTTIEKNTLPKGIYYLQIISGTEKLVYDFVED